MPAGDAPGAPQARNVHSMELVEGHGNEFVGGRAREGDAINRVYVVDSDELPFHQAEVRLLDAHSACGAHHRLAHGGRVSSAAELRCIFTALHCRALHCRAPWVCAYGGSTGVLVSYPP